MAGLCDILSLFLLGCGFILEVFPPRVYWEVPTFRELKMSNVPYVLRIRNVEVYDGTRRRDGDISPTVKRVSTVLCTTNSETGVDSSHRCCAKVLSVAGLLGFLRSFLAQQ